MTTELDTLTEQLGALITQAENKFIGYGVSAEVELDGGDKKVWSAALEFAKREGVWGFYIRRPGVPTVHWSHCSRADRAKIPASLAALQRALEAAVAGETRKVQEAISSADRFLRGE